MRRVCLLAVLMLFWTGAAAAGAAGAVVSPSEAADLQPIELSQLIAALLPPANASGWTWDYQPPAPLKWLSSEPVPDPVLGGTADRIALARVRVRGKDFKVPEWGSTQEQAWSLRMAGDAKLQAPADMQISLDPPGGHCVAPEWAQCWFTTQDIFAGGGLSHRLLCSKFVSDSRPGPSIGGAIYLVSAPGKRSTVLVYYRSANLLGGRSSTIYLWPFVKAKDFCTRL